jgi:hypothetical protein
MNFLIWLKLLSKEEFGRRILLDTFGEHLLNLNRSIILLFGFIHLVLLNCCEMQSSFFFFCRDLQSYLSRLSTFLKLNHQKLYFLVDNISWMRVLGLLIYDN